MVKAAVFCVAALALVCGLWLAFKPGSPDTRTAAPVAIATAVKAVSSAQANSPPLSDQAGSSRDRVFELDWKKGRLVSGAARLQVYQGDRIVLEIASDTGDELHVHGYDVRAPVTPDEITTLRFIATLSGRFGLELHRA